MLNTRWRIGWVGVVKVSRNRDRFVGLSVSIFVRTREGSDVLTGRRRGLYKKRVIGKKDEEKVKKKKKMTIPKKGK